MIDKMKEGIGIGILSGFVASLCCLGPLVIILLGLSSVFGITGLCMVEYRPVFLTLGIATLSSGVILWLKGEEGSCNLEAGKKNKNLILISVVAMVVSYIFFIELLVPFLKEQLIFAASCSI